MNMLILGENWTAILCAAFQTWHDNMRMILFEGQIMGENAGKMIWEEREDGKV
jgi:hypothetical protein